MANAAERSHGMRTEKLIVFSDKVVIGNLSKSWGLTPGMCSLKSEWDRATV